MPRSVTTRFACCPSVASCRGGLSTWTISPRDPSLTDLAQSDVVLAQMCSARWLQFAPEANGGETGSTVASETSAVGRILQPGRGTYAIFGLRRFHRDVAPGILLVAEKQPRSLRAR